MSTQCLCKRHTVFVQEMCTSSNSKPIYTVNQNSALHHSSHHQLPQTLASTHNYYTQPLVTTACSGWYKTKRRDSSFHHFAPSCWNITLTYHDRDSQIALRWHTKRYWQEGEFTCYLSQIAPQIKVWESPSMSVTGIRGNEHLPPTLNFTGWLPSPSLISTGWLPSYF